MADFPDDLFTGRDVEDRAGVVYDADKTKVFYAKDHNDVVAEVEAIETFLGANGRAIFSSRSELSAPQDADYFGVQDNSDSKILKYLTFTGLKSFLKTYFDTLYLLNSVFPFPIINGNFDVWQRGTSVACTTANAYTSDRWYVDTATAGDDKTVSIQDGTGVEGSYYCARVQRVNGETGHSVLRLSQALESQDSIKLRGKKLTLSFWARKGANFSATDDLLTAKIVTGKGTDQKLISFTTSADAISEDKTLTTSWQKFTITTTNEIASDITQIGVSFSFDPTGTAGASDYFEITQIQLNVGDTAYPFQPKTFDEEFEACQRFYQTLTAPYGVLAHMQSSQIAIAFYFFNKSMRVAPSVAISGSWNFSMAGGSDATIVGGSGTTVYQWQMEGTTTSSYSTGQAGRLRSGNAAFSAEF